MRVPVEPISANRRRDRTGNPFDLLVRAGFTGAAVCPGRTRADRRRIVKRIESLAGNSRPPGVKKLSGKERYRIRQGRYRILYSIRDRELNVYIVRIGDRKSVHRDS